MHDKSLKQQYIGSFANMCRNLDKTSDIGVEIPVFTPCLKKYSQSEARITVAYSAECNG